MFRRDIVEQNEARILDAMHIHPNSEGIRDN
jgi:hypothetical protein